MLLPAAALRLPSGTRLKYSALTLLAACCVAACNGVGDPSAGVAPGPSVPQCSTGTQVVLVRPIPGTAVAHTTRSVEIASSAAVVANSELLLVAEGPSPGPSISPELLYGPVGPPKTRKSVFEVADIFYRLQPDHKPTPSPSPVPTAPIPFPSPVFYKAKGFALQSSTTYAVKVDVAHSNCTPRKIGGAIFRTKP
jgi:hypothetical protein